MSGSWPVEHWDRMYAEAVDPYGFREKWYERRKYALTVAALPRERYPAALELACSVGELTRGLAPHCEHLLALDAAAAAVATARETVAEHPHVQVERATLPGEWPQGSYDLVVFSELGYFLGAADLDALVERIAGSLRPGGHCVAVHWRVPSADLTHTGDEVHARLRAQPGWDRVGGYVEDAFLLDLLERR